MRILGIVLLIGIVVAGSSHRYVIGYTRGMSKQSWRSGIGSGRALFIEQYYLEETERRKVSEVPLRPGDVLTIPTVRLSIEDLVDMQINWATITKALAK